MATPRQEHVPLIQQHHSPAYALSRSKHESNNYPALRHESLSSDDMQRMKRIQWHMIHCFLPPFVYSCERMHQTGGAQERKNEPLCINPRTWLCMRFCVLMFSVNPKVVCVCVCVFIYAYMCKHVMQKKTYFCLCDQVQCKSM